ncbi:TetR/AcrR family transcriptional regulator [Mobilicoccus pelagius]|uniref:Putative TetR family transcriptional regulator n=1 Tax=Mobilicoccus pelagius NBRC 104925 TaxID=1089455 RepID=H5UPS4_9MICO|nr:TetR/AcrR family transcriptional regulator [Mobilicoccus pelagius]GAB47729.1 putative TetR family transcriptional regulator [Mobilicoccus pelagius NBRC 104925]
MRVDAEENRRALIAAAWRLFSEQGPQASMRAVAAEAGVGVATLYRHFPAREDLLLGLVAEVHERVTAVVQAHTDGWDADPAREWAGFVRDVAGLRLGTLVGEMAPVAAGITEFEERTAELRGRTLGAIEKVLGRARHDGLARDDLDAPRFFAALSVLSRPLPEPASRLLPDGGEWIVEVFLDGLACRPSRLPEVS